MPYSPTLPWLKDYRPAGEAVQAFNDTPIPAEVSKLLHLDHPHKGLSTSYELLASLAAYLKQYSEIGQGEPRELQAGELHKKLKALANAVYDFTQDSFTGGERDPQKNLAVISLGSDFLNDALPFFDVDYMSRRKLLQETSAPEFAARASGLKELADAWDSQHIGAERNNPYRLTAAVAGALDFEGLEGECRGYVLATYHLIEQLCAIQPEVQKARKDKSADRSPG